MRIGLWNLEPKVENTAMMQVSQYHKNKGDQVELYSPLFSYDRLYVFSIFSFTPKPRTKPNMICGGTGFNITNKLPPEIEACDLDYSIFPNCKTSYLRFSLGCNRKCPFCVVFAKEGYNHPVLPKNTNPNGQYVSVMDNNFFENKNWSDAIDYLKQINQPVCFQCGLDVRIFNDEQGQALKELRLSKKSRLHVAWDNPKDMTVPDHILDLTQYIPSYKISCYILIGYWSTMEEDLMRVETLRNHGIDSFVMPFNRSDPYQKAFARWVNHKATFKSVSWQDYKHGSWKGIETVLLNHV